MSNSSEIIPDILSTDTHGANHVNFALLDLSGYSFAPRYKQVGRVINDMFNLEEDEDGAAKLSLKKPINTKRIYQHWDTVQRILLSLKNRTTTQATLVRKLSGYRSNHPLMEALTEYDRMVKANYLLNYITDPELRNHVQRALNRGEAYHQLRRAISNVNGDRFRGNSDEEIQLWNECARLVANAITYFNSSVLSRLMASFENQNDVDRLEIVLQVSPVAWFNINLKGTYHFDFSDRLPDIDELMSAIEGYKPPEKSNTPCEASIGGAYSGFWQLSRENPQYPFYLGKTQRGFYVPKVKTDRKRFRSKLKKVGEWIQIKRSRDRLPLIWKSFCAKLRGHIAYYAVSFNTGEVSRFIGLATKIVFKWLNRRSQRKSFTWEQFERFLEANPLPKVRVVHRLY